MNMYIAKKEDAGGENIFIPSTTDKNKPLFLHLERVGWNTTLGSQSFLCPYCY